MRVPNELHESQGWVICDVAHDLELLDVWALPVSGKDEDFQTFVEMMASFDPRKADSPVARALWLIRDRLGEWLHLDASPADEDGTDLRIPGTNETTLAGRLPKELRGTADDVDFDLLPVVPLYLTDTEAAIEISNRTVHGVLHFGWVEQGDDMYRGEMAIYVKPRGVLGKAYLALIQPFRHLVVYPALMRQIERAWEARRRGPDRGASRLRAR